jgi:UPF0716 protein FxsA
MPLLLLLLVVVPIVELYVIIQVGQAIGFLPTLALLVLSSVLGTTMMRVQGRAAWQRFAAAANAGRPPATEAVDGALVLLGGALLLAPGFVTDVFGLLLLLPPTRVLLRRLAFRGMLERIATSFRMPGRPPAGYDVDGTAHDVTPRDRDRLDP